MIERYHIKGWNNDQIETKASDGEWVRYADHLSALTASASEPGEPVTVTYRNWRGEIAERQIRPIRMWFGSTEWHPEPQWLITALDVAKDAERDFALSGFCAPVPASEPEPVAWQGRNAGDERWTNLRRTPGVGAWDETRPLYANPVPTPDGAVEAKPDGLRETILAVLRDYRMYNFSEADDASSGYPLVDMCTPKGQGIDKGEEELFLIADEIAAALSHPADGWRDIESAPTDGTQLRVRYEDGTVEDGVYFSAERYCVLGAPQGSRGPGWVSTEAGNLPVDDPDAWMPLPAAKPEGE